MLTDQLENYYEEKKITLVITARKYPRMLELIRTEFSATEVRDEQNEEEIVLIRNKKS